MARNPVAAYFFSVSAVDESIKSDLLNPDILSALKGYDSRQLFYDIYEKAPAEDHLSKIQYLDIKTYLCEDILTMGFGVQILEWLRNELKDYAETLILKSRASDIFFNRSFLTNIWNQHQKGLRNWSSLLWFVMMFNLWYKKFIESE